MIVPNRFDPELDIPFRFLELLRLREGFRRKVYQGKRDAKGVWTVGTGHKLTPEEMKKWNLGQELDDDTLRQLERDDLERAWRAAQKQAREIGVPAMADTLLGVNFQLGTSWYKDVEREDGTVQGGHVKTWELLMKGDFNAAAVEAANSDWNKQTPTRVRDFQRRLRGLSTRSEVVDRPEVDTLPPSDELARSVAKTQMELARANPEVTRVQNELFGKRPEGV